LTIFAENDRKDRPSQCGEQKLRIWDGRTTQCSIQYRRVVDPDRIAAFAAELVRLTPDVIWPMAVRRGGTRREDSLVPIVLCR
jgi:hypothetical protein